VFWRYGFMAMRKMTLSVPEPLGERLQARDVALIRACEIANQELDVAGIEKEFDGIGDQLPEPWKRSRSKVKSGG